MSGSLPASRPQLAPSDVRKIAQHLGITVSDPKHPAVLGIRGYYRDSMGKPGKNDRGIYDDAAFVILHDRCVAFNFNTDPTGFVQGRAVLEPGLWFFIPGKHHLSSPPPKGRPAFRQFGQFNIRRDGVKNVIRGEFGINLHDGGDEHTSSEGCQTVPKSQWVEFKTLLQKALGVDDGDCMEHPGGISGKQFAYGLVTREHAEEILGKSL